MQKQISALIMTALMMQIYRARAFELQSLVKRPHAPQNTNELIMINLRPGHRIGMGTLETSPVQTFTEERDEEKKMETTEGEGEEEKQAKKSSASRHYQELMIHSKNIVMIKKMERKSSWFVLFNSIS